MSPFAQGNVGDLPPAVIGSPRRSDFSVLKSAVTEAGVPAREFAPGLDLEDDFQSIGCLILTQEALSDDLVQRIGTALHRQPVWSEPPIVVVAEESMTSAARDIVREHWLPAKTIFQNRPLRVNEFRGAVQLAIASRLRQFQIRDRIAQEEELRRELNHRVKNILATVQSIASMTRRMSRSQDDAFDQFMARLEALGNVHSSLQAMAEGETSFEHVVTEVTKPYRTNTSMITVSGPARPLQPQSASLIGLCMYELLTNAMKYGALSVPSGDVETVLVETATGADLKWVERNGPPASTPERSGYGSRFIILTLGALFGEPPRVTYDEAGFSLRVEGPADELFEPLSR